MVSRRLAVGFSVFVLAVSAFIVGAETIPIIQYVFSSTLRMIAAYAASLCFSVFFGIWMGHNEKAFRYLLPFMDILQSVPILGFLPLAVLFLIGIPVLGPELATVFLIFSCMAWSTLFNVVEGVRAIPAEVKDASRLMGVEGISYLTNIVLPAIYPQIISGSIAGWGGSWYFLVVGEYTTFGGVLHQRPGIGYFIASSAYAGDVFLSLLGIGFLSSVVLLFNTFVWMPLLRESSRFRYSEEEEEVPPLLPNYFFGDVIEETGERMSGFFEKTLRVVNPILKSASVDPSFRAVKPNKFFTFALISLVAFALVFILITNPADAGSPVSLAINALSSITRIIIAYAIALSWTVAVGLAIGRSRLRKYLMPLFDIGQSIPAVAVFPIIVITVIRYLSGYIGIDASIEFASVLLLLTGMQWYLLFNILRAMKNIPSEIVELGDVFQMNRLSKMRHVLLPAILPAIIAGSIQAIGGGWNATIVSEYIIDKGLVLHPASGGLGYLLSYATAEGNLTLVLTGVLAMVLIVIATDKLIWSRAVKKTSDYSF